MLWVRFRDSLIPLAVFIPVKRTSKTSETFKSLLLSLCISDRGVGFLMQPLYVAYLTMEITKNSTKTDNIIAYWAVVKAYAIPHSLLVFASFFGVFAITVDRFLAIHLHNLRYPKLVTHKRIVAVVISCWVFSVIACFWYESIGVFPVMSVVCIITTGLLYCKICAAVRHHTNQIRAQQVPDQVAQNGDMANIMPQGWEKLPLLHFTCISCFSLFFHIYSLFKKYINSSNAKLRRERRRTVKNNNRSN